MSDAIFHWRKYEAAHWLLSQITTNKRKPYYYGYSVRGEPSPPSNRYKYEYKQFNFSDIVSSCNDFSADELDAALDTLHINKHIDVKPEYANPSNPLLIMNDDGRKAYESLYYLALRDQQKGVSINLKNAENTLLDFLNVQHFRIKTYNVALLSLTVSVVLLLSRLGCNR